MKNKMRNNIVVGRVGVVILICLSMIMTSAAIPIGNSLQLNNQTMFTFNRMSYSFEFKEPSLQSKNVDGSDYTTISMPGCLAVGKQAGDPMMPVKTISLLLPPKTAISRISVIGTPVPVELSSVDLTERPIFPSQPSIPIGNDQLPEFTINTDVYSSDALYPSATYSDYSVGYSHGYAILSMSLYPLHYNPTQGTLVYYPKMTVTITLKADSSANQLFRNNPSDEAYVKTLVSNPDIASRYPMAGLPILEYPGGLCDPSDSYDYVIVTTTQNGLNHWDTTTTTPYNWDSLMAKHTGDGLSSNLLTVQDINACSDYQNSTPLFNDGPAHIREFCRDAYADWGARFVLIAGDADTIAARQLYYAYEGNVDSDLYWSNLDNNFNADNDNRWGEEADAGFDLFSELFIGRITCDNPQDVSNWLTKNFYYADSADEDYLDNAAFYGGDTTWNCQGDDFIDYSAIKGTNNWLGPNPGSSGPFPTWAGFQFGFETWNLVNPTNQFNLSVKFTEAPSPNPGWSGQGVVGFRNAINNDQVTLIAGIAHANNQMSLDVDASAWQSQYHNTKPFFLHDYGCHCGDFDDGDDGIIETMLFKSDVKLSFGCIYNTGYGWGQFDDTNSSSAFQQKAFWDYFFDMENNSGDFNNWQLGIGQAWSKDMMAPTINWDYSSGTWRGVIECCLLFGDPAQTIKTPHPSESPLQPTTPNGKTLGIWHEEYTYTSISTDPENEQIFYLFDWDDGSNSGWLGPYNSGFLGTGSHIWTELGTYEVRVKARDIWGAGSIWSEPLIVTITDNTPPSVPDIDGPPKGKPGNPYLFNIVSADAQNQDIYYFIDWGDGTNSGWLGPYVSGTIIHITHSWTDYGNFAVKAKAKDTYDSESDWGTLDVVMPVETTLPGSTVYQQLVSGLQLGYHNIH
jgi:hypothetical protein